MYSNNELMKIKDEANKYVEQVTITNLVDELTEARRSTKIFKVLFWITLAGWFLQ